MGWLSRLLSGPPKPAEPPAVQSPAAAPSVPTPAERRTYILSGSVSCAQFSSDHDRYPVDVVTDPEHYDALLSAWVEDRPERFQTVFLRPDPHTESGVLVQRSPATTLGRLTPVDASLYRGLIEAIMNLGLACTAVAKTVGGTGERQRLKLKLSLDGPQQIGGDFGIPSAQLVPRAAEPIAAQSRKRRPPADSIEALPTDHPRFIGVVGESHYQEALRRLAASGPTALVTIEGDPDNPHDQNAVRIADITGQTLGYLARGQYTQLKRLARERPLRCRAEFRGGTAEKPSVGLVLDIGETFSGTTD